MHGTIWSGPGDLGPGRTRPIFFVFCEKICHHFRGRSAHGNFFPHQILSSITKLQRRRRPASEQDKLLSDVKTVQILRFARHDLKKKFLSASPITESKIWRRQFLLRYLVDKKYERRFDRSTVIFKFKFMDKIIPHIHNF